MPTIEEIRTQYPQYGDMSDGQLADALHTKFYADMPKDEFNKKIGLNVQPSTYEESQSNVAKQFLKGVPILGAGIDQAGAAISAAANPLTGAGQTGDSFSDRYAKNLEIEKSGSKDFERQNPKVSTAANVAGGIASTLPLGLSAGAAKLFGFGEGPLLANMGRGALANSALSGADALARGEDVTGNAGAGAVMGAVAPAIGRALGVGAKAVMSSPTSEELKAAAKQGYETARKSGIELKPQALTDLSTQVKTQLNGMGVNEVLAPKTFGVLDTIGSAPAGATVTVDNFRTLQRALGTAAKSIDPTERMAASKALEALNGHMENINPNNLLRGTAGDLAKVSKTIKEANANYAASKRSDLVQGKVDRAELNAATANSGQNLDNSLRQQVKSILTNPKALRGFSDEEKSAMMKVAAGTAPGNIIRHVGNLLGGGGGLGALTTGAAAAYATGPVGLAAPLAGWALKKAGNAITANNIAKLDELIRSRSPLAKQQFAKALQQAGSGKSQALQTLMSAAFLQDPTGKLNRAIAQMFKSLPSSGAMPAGAEGDQGNAPRL